MVKEKSLVPLKMLVISLGVMLLGGMVLLVAGIANKAGQSAICGKVDVDWSERGAVLEAHPQGKEVVFVLKKQDDSLEVVTLDACTGHEKSALRVKER